MKNLNAIFFSILFVLVTSVNSQSQDQTFNLGAINIQYADTLGGTKNQLFFDIVLLHTNPEASLIFEYSAGQYFLNFNPDIANGGTLSYKIVDSELPSIFQPRNPSIVGNLLRLAGNVLVHPGPIISTVSPGTKIVRMRLTTSASSFANIPFDLEWRLSGTFRTKIFAYDNYNYEITENGTYYIDSLFNVNLLNPLQNSTEETSTVNFIWNKINTAANYTLQISNDSNMNSIFYKDSLITDTSKLVNGFTHGNEYYWRIKVTDTSGIPFYSKVNSFYTKQLSVYPPDNSEDMPQSFTFEWNKPGTNVAYYLLSISKDSLLNESFYLDTLTSDTSIYLRGFEYNSEFFWKVKAFYNDSSTDISNIKSFKTKTVNVHLSYPADSAVNQANTINFSWEMPVITVNRFYLKISEDSLQNNIVFYDSVFNSTNKTVGPFELNKKYYWSVSIRDSFNNFISSEIRNFKTGILTINFVYPPNNSVNISINTILSWERPVINVSRYKLIVSRDSLQNDIVVIDSTITDTMKNVSGLEFETRYYWTVTAYDTIGNIKTSDVWNFRTTTFLYLPRTGSTIYGNSNYFVWFKLPGAISYKLEVANDNNFSNILFYDDNLIDSIRFVLYLPYAFNYYWRISARDTNGYFRTSETWNFGRDFPAPVELSSFISVINQNNVTLNWSTAAETNNSGFEIERSENDIWTKLGSVSGNGTSTDAHSYSFTDRNLISGKYNYRLKQLDFNGNYEYFNLNDEVNIGIPLKYELSQNYPNPFNPSTKINFSLPAEGKVNLKIFDLSGKEVMTLVSEVRAAGYHSVYINGSNLSSGVYFYVLSADNFTASKKMILIK